MTNIFIESVLKNTGCKTLKAAHIQLFIWESRYTDPDILSILNILFETLDSAIADGESGK